MYMLDILVQYASTSTAGVEAFEFLDVDPLSLHLLHRAPHHTAPLIGRRDGVDKPVKISLGVRIAVGMTTESKIKINKSNTTNG